MGRTASFICSVVSLLMTIAKCHSQLACSPWSAVNITDPIILYNGSAWDRENNVLYPPNTYWTTTADGDTHVYGCPCRLDGPCLRKCCERNEAMDQETQDCTPVKKPWPWFRPRANEVEELTVRTAEADHFRLLFGKTCVGYLLEPENNPEDRFFLNFTDGTLSIPEIKRTGIDTSGFCLEYLPKMDRYLPYVCLNEIFPNSAPEYCEELREVMYPLGMSISIFFLLISLTVYITTSELRNLHGKCLICHIVSLLGAYILHLISRAVKDELTSGGCRVLGFIIYFGLLSSFLWLNAICIDVCIAFSHLRPTRRQHDEEGERRFLFYVLYAWGAPMAIIIIIASLSFHRDLKDSFLAPEFRTICGFNRGKSRLAYFVVPMGIIILFNIILFAITSYNIRKITKETSILSGSGNGMTRADKERFNLYVKLLVVMGISWVFGSWLLELLNYFYGSTSCMWLFTDTLNAMQGLFIFIIFVYKRNVKKLMRKKIRRIVSLMAPNAPIWLQNLEGTTDISSTSSPNTPGAKQLR